jgi:hypothetical protein
MRRAAVALVLACALGGCDWVRQQTPGALGVRGAQLVAVGDEARLDLALDCRLSGPMQDAIDHGIPVTLVVDVRSGRWPHALRATRRVELRYFPLSRRYQLRAGDGEEVRSFPTRNWLVAGLGSLRLRLPAAFAQLPADARIEVRAGIDAAALPGALRLPALFEPAWRLASADTTWPVATR